MSARRGFVLVVVLFTALLASAYTNLNSSRSNVYRVGVSSGLTTPAQVKSLVAALDKAGPMDEAALKKWLAANFKRYGIDPAKVKKIAVVRPDKDVKETVIVVLTNPADEQMAVANVKSSKSNSSE